jgi:hypothetical protein
MAISCDSNSPMPAPKRASSWVLVLSPRLGDDGSADAVKLGRTACREAYLQKRTPVFPLLECISYMTEEEMERDYLERCKMWARRVSAIWICLREKCKDLDVVTYQMLFDNENGSRNLLSLRHYQAKSRLPVYRFTVQDSGAGVYAVKPMGREDIDLILQCNVMSGLFRGMAAPF